MRDLLRRIFRLGSVDEDLREEMQFHLDKRAELNEQAGMPAEEARRSALRQFGNRLNIYEDTRRIHINTLLDTIAQDLRHAIRGFAQTPVFTLTAIFAIALGIGSTTAVFSVVDLILFRSLPYAEDDRLVSVGMTAPILPDVFLLGTDYVEWRRNQTPFEAFTSMTGVPECDVTEDQPVRLRCASVESTFLDTFGIRPVIGRPFTRDEDQVNSPRVGLISYGLWLARFGGNPAVLDRTISLDGRTFRIIGVLPRDFELPTLAHADLVIPHALPEDRQVRPNSGRVLEAYARLKPGVTLKQAEAALQPLFAESLKWIPANFVQDVKLQIRSVRDNQIRDSKQVSWILLAAVFAVLIIACANVANLLLARAASRQQEFAVRSAIGAGRARLIRQALTENLILAALGGVLGCGIAYGFVRILSVLAPAGIPRLAQAGLDLRVLLFAVIVTLGAGLFFGMFPAVQAPRPETLVGWRVMGSRLGRSRPLLITIQIAMSLVLLSGAGLLLRTLWNLQTVHLGLRTENVMTVSMVLGPQSYPTPQSESAFFEDVEARASAIPGVAAAGISDSVPPDTPPMSTLLAHVAAEGRPTAVEGTGGAVPHRMVTADYFSALGIPILRGRAFTEDDRTSSERILILSESLARILFQDVNAVDKRIKLATGASEFSWFRIVGVVGDVKNSALAQPNLPEYYEVRPRGPVRSGVPPLFRRRAVLTVRSAIAPQLLANVIRREIAEVDRTLPVTIETMAQSTAKLSARPMFNAVLLTIFAVIGIVLAAVGLYGVIAFIVAQRTQEIGIRLAMGATTRNIMYMVLGQAARWSIAGVFLGVAGSLFATRFLRTMLYAVPERDPQTLAVSIAVLLAVAFAAAWLPSRRAAQVDPVVTLRRE